MRILDARNVTVRKELRVIGEEPNRVLWYGTNLVANEADDMTRVFGFLIGAGKLTGKSVAWIGGGFCTGPRAFAVADCKQTVYELEPALIEFCPSGIEFIAGDWRDTISGQFDLIIFDLGGDPPYAELETFLNPGGFVLPRKA